MIGAPVSKMIAALEAGEITAESLVAAHLGHIRENDDEIGAFLHVDEAGALAAARAVDTARSAGERLGPLAGIPVAIKDNIHIAGMKTTCGSRMLADFIAPFDATVTTRLREAGAILIGKTNLDEFAMGSSTEYSAIRKTRNPHDPARVPGGSSGGSTAAVAAGMVPLALGSSTGGSIRQPAAFCGVVGMKPSYGRVSRYGLVAYGSSLDQIGPIAGDVDGAARLLEVISGHDPLDSTSAGSEVPDLTAPGDPDHQIRIGLIDAFMDKGLDPAIHKALDGLISAWRDAGAETVDCAFPHTPYAIPAYYLVATAEASANLARFDGVRYAHRTSRARDLEGMYTLTRDEGFGPEVKRRIMLGTYCLSSGYYEGFYLRAQKVRTRIIDDFRRAFTRADVLVAPTTPTTAFRFGEKTDDPVSMYLSDIYTVPANLAGIPAVSIPAGTDSAGLPIGIQLMSDRFSEAMLLELARRAEQLIHS